MGAYNNPFQKWTSSSYICNILIWTLLIPHWIHYRSSKPPPLEEISPIGLFPIVNFTSKLTKYIANSIVYGELGTNHDVSFLDSTADREYGSLWKSCTQFKVSFLFWNRTQPGKLIRYQKAGKEGD